MRSFTRLTVFLYVWLCASLLTASPPYDGLLQDLASEDYAVRQRATRELLADDQIYPDPIIQLYARARLPEQHHRLLDIARHHAIRKVISAQYTKEGQGAIGITHDTVGADQSEVPGRPGIVVTETFPGFPGHTYLQRGDVILSINDAPFPSGLPNKKIAEQFMATVKGHPSGATIRLSVYRSGNTVQLEFPLAHLDALQSVYKGPGNLQQPFLESWLTARRNMLNAHRHKRQPSKPPLTDPDDRTDIKDTKKLIQENPANR